MSIPRVILTIPEDCPEWLDRSLLNAYWGAEYRVFTEHEEWILRHGEPHLSLEKWMQLRGFSSLAIVTACNPGSVLLEDAENRRRNAALEQDIRLLGLPFGPALNQSAEGEWPEPGFWIAGISLEEAVALGVRFGQNGVVWVG
ncbi:MAG: DUF3293 domain-containing protein [Saprospiraceae bacterium]|nr:DUF3293 domain-containing protein [Saprospiraceae bacterium]